MSNTPLGIATAASNLQFYSLASLPPLQQGKTNPTFSASNTVNRAVGGPGLKSPPGTYSFDLGLTLSAPSNPNRAYTEVLGDIKGTLSGTIQTTIQVTGSPPPPTSVADLLNQSFTNARASLAKAGIADPTNVDLARQAVNQAISLREQSAATSVDLNYRDAEYILRGYAGGLLLNSLSPSQYGASPYGGPGDLSNDLANTAGPIGAAAYNAKKIYNNLVGNSGANSSGTLPASPPGGMGANTSGFLQGLSGASPADLLKNPDYNAPIPVIDNSPQNPIVPSIKLNQNSADPNLFNPSIAVFDVDPASTYYVDPALSQAYIFAVAGNEFSGLVLPGTLGLTAPVEVSYGTCTVALNPGATLMFSDSCSADGTGNDFGQFAVTGVNLPGQEAFVVGLDFAQAGRVLLFEQAVGVAGATEVPEPHALAVLLPGLVAAAFVARRREVATR